MIMLILSTCWVAVLALFVLYLAFFREKKDSASGGPRA